MTVANVFESLCQTNKKWRIQFSYIIALEDDAIILSHGVGSEPSIFSLQSLDYIGRKNPINDKIRFSILPFAE